MKAKLFVFCLAMAFGFGILTPAFAEEAPSIEGTYEFVSRDLPDGSTQTPPNMVGLITYTKTRRNFNVYWTSPDGKRTSFSSISSYVLTPTEYQETAIYHMANDEINAQGIQYDLSGKSGTATVTIEGGKMSIQLPLYDEPLLTFQGDTFTATKPGRFTDHWKKVE